MTLTVRTKHGNHSVIAATNSSTLYAHIYKPTDDDGFVRKVTLEQANKIIYEQHLGDPLL